MRVGRDGNFYVSDEYGPYIRKFNRQGHLLARIAVPAKFLLDPVAGVQSGDINNPVDAASLELTPANNITGRQANRGMEGLAITPDGKMLVGMMQNALIQDNGLNVVPTNTVPGRRGLNNRILTIDLETGETHEYVYTMDAHQPGARRQRDPGDQRSRVPGARARQPHAGSRRPPSAAPNLKRIYRIDLSKNGLQDVTDVSDVAEPAGAGGADAGGLNITPVPKMLFIDMLEGRLQGERDADDQGRDRREDGRAGLGAGSAGRPARALRRSATTICTPASRRRSTRSRWTAPRRASPTCRSSCRRRCSRPGQVKKALK